MSVYSRMRTVTNENNNVIADSVLVITSEVAIVIPQMPSMQRNCIVQENQNRSKTQTLDFRSYIL